MFFSRGKLLAYHAEKSPLVPLTGVSLRRRVIGDYISHASMVPNEEGSYERKILKPHSALSGGVRPHAVPSIPL